MKKKIVLSLTLHVDIDPAKLDDDSKQVKQEVQDIVDGVQKHFNKDLSNTFLSDSRIVTANVKLDTVEDSTTGEVMDMN